VRAVSPLAPGLPGLVLLAWSAQLAVSEHRALRWIPLPGHAFGAGFRALLVSGVLALLGAAMIIPLFLPARWRRAHSDGQPGGDDQPDQEPVLLAPVAEPADLGGPAEQAGLSGPR
jgi:hypothetical protein